MWYANQIQSKVHFGSQHKKLVKISQKLVVVVLKLNDELLVLNNTYNTLIYQI